ncbi:hypothetical protein A3749_13185 [Oleiphilus sp. HI0078]|nr:hypothetical protein A3743_11645 [Oleiphilus sp. HI0072]KZY96387.1 hypothetical protein A3743_22210 [Oleiphilus sp. HI0072]KZZ09589.1 hypothetical protein A3749_13185 [Oleiphilus sp. HI0078]
MLFFKKEAVLGIDASNLVSGGGLRHLVEFLSHAQPNEFDFDKVTLWVGPTTAKKIHIKADWLHIVEVKEFEKGLFSRFLWRARYMKPYVNEHCSVLFSPGGLTLGCDVPEVTMSRNMQPFDEVARKRIPWSKPRLRLELLKVFQARSFRKANEVIFLNEFAQSTLSSMLALTKGVVIPHGCSKAFQLEPRQQKGFGDNSDIDVLYVSTLDTYKHQIEVIEAIAKLRTKYSGIKLTLVGSGDSEYGELVKSKIHEIDAKEAYIRYVGEVGLGELTQYYHNSDIFLYASSCENLPNILLEAMSAGLPIACSNIQPMPSILKRGGAYFNPESVESIAGSLDDLIKNIDKRKDCSMLAFEESQTYSWQKCTDETFAVLRDAISSI